MSHRASYTKTTMYCPQKNCKYHARVWLQGPAKPNKISNASHTCPLHRLKLKTNKS